MVHPGTRRPLFTSVGGIAIMQALPAREVEAILADNIAQEKWFRGSGRLESLQKMRERSDKHGFGVNLGDVVTGVHAFAVPVRDSQDQVFAALCLMGTPELYDEEGIPSLRRELDAVASVLEGEAKTSNLSIGIFLHFQYMKLVG